MKKIKILFSLSIFSVIFGMSSVSADGASLVATIQGSPLTFVSVDAVTKTGVYSDGKEIDTKEVASNGTVTNEKEKATTTKDTLTDTNDSNFDLATNFEIDGDVERANGMMGTNISEMAQVHSGQDLHTFIQSLVVKNKDITSVSTEEDRVSMTRVMPTKLFGFIPSHIKETVSVVSWGDGTNEVVVTRPWWNLFSKDEIAKDSVSADMESRMKNIPSGEFKTVLDATTKARIITEIESTFKVSSSTLIK
jgi:hypothetical protein